MSNIDSLYSSFEQQLALTWAQAHLTDYMCTHADCSAEEKRTVFLEALEGGFHLALDLRD